MTSPSSQSLFQITNQSGSTVMSKSKQQIKSESTPSNGGGKSSGKKKVEDEFLNVHISIQQAFANLLGQHLNDIQGAQSLQCCVAYNKPCGCIRRFILAGPEWKEANLPNYGFNHNNPTDENLIKDMDQQNIAEPQLQRGSNLLKLFHRALELKKEKCYPVNSAGCGGGGDQQQDGGLHGGGGVGPNGGKAGKELRGMIGLGNGRKRSKKYEEFVMSQRQLLRHDYSLCEKAAMKLLGYSINFLYKKLRTNPNKESRIVTKDAATRANKAPRNLLTLEQLRDMADPQQASNQCCCRNCISWLVKQHFDKIVEWRKRLEGSGQRGAQEIVAEVLLVSASLDGQNSFCQNLVHWVTGCSFKKIRRIRDHLKKNPNTLPEHGLKKYWQDKAKTRKPDQPLPKTLKIEQPDDGLVYGGSNLTSSFPHEYRASGNQIRTTIQQQQATNNPIINANNNNRYESPNNNNTTTTAAVVTTQQQQQQQHLFRISNEPQLQPIVYQPSQQPQQQPPPQQQGVTFTTVQDSMTAAGAQQQQNTKQILEQQYMVTTEQSAGGQSIQQMYPVYQQPQPQAQQIYRHDEATNTFQPQHIQQPQQQAHRIDEYATVQPLQQQQTNNPPPAYSEAQQTKQQQQQQQYVSYQTPHIIDGFHLKRNGQPSYYLTPATSKTTNGNVFTNVTPVLVAQYPQQQAQQQQFTTATTTNATTDENAQQQAVQQQQMQQQQMGYIQAGQQDYNLSQFVLLSPALPNDGKSYTPGDLENLHQIGVPVTPIQLGTGYFGQIPDQNKQTNGGTAVTTTGQVWNQDTAQQFLFPISNDGNNGGTIFNTTQQINQQQQQQQIILKQPDQQQQVNEQQQQQQQCFQQLTPVALMQSHQGNTPLFQNFQNVRWITTAQPIMQAATQAQTEQQNEVAGGTKLAVLNTVQDNQPKVNVAWGQAGGQPTTMTIMAPVNSSTLMEQQPATVVVDNQQQQQQAHENKDNEQEGGKPAGIGGREKRVSRSRIYGHAESPALTPTIVGNNQDNGDGKNQNSIFKFPEPTTQVKAAQIKAQDALLVQGPTSTAIEDKGETGKTNEQGQQQKPPRLMSLAEDYNLPSLLFEPSPSPTTTSTNEDNNKKNNNSSNTPTLKLPQRSPNDCSLHTPNSGLITPTTQTLNTPNAVLSTPTQVHNSPSQQIHDSDIQSVDLMPAPKKRKSQTNEDLNRSRKRHNTTSPDKQLRQQKMMKKIETTDSVFPESSTTTAAVTQQHHQHQQISFVRLPVLSPSTNVGDSNVMTSQSMVNVNDTQQLNTPVFLSLPRSGALTPAAFMQHHNGQVSSSQQPSTPQIFTFMTAGTNFPTQMFLSNGKSPMKGQPSQSDVDGMTSLQTPSRISVVTPSAYMNHPSTMSASTMLQTNTTSAVNTAAPQPAVFCFQEPLTKQLQQQQQQQTSSAGGNKKDDNSSATSDNKKMKLPKLVVQLASSPTAPTSQDNDDVSKTSSTSLGDDDNSSKKKSLHRMRSGGKTDLILPLSSFVSSNDFVVQSPLNTPSAIQVITPTHGGPSSCSVTNQQRRSNTTATGLCVRPASLVMAAPYFGLSNTSSSNATSSTTSTNQTSPPLQVATPTVFHLISPSQTTPPSPSVVVYPFPGPTPRSYQQQMQQIEHQQQQKAKQQTTETTAATTKTETTNSSSSIISEHMTSHRPSSSPSSSSSSASTSVAATASSSGEGGDVTSKAEVETSSAGNTTSSTTAAAASAEI